MLRCPVQARNPNAERSLYECMHSLYPPPLPHAAKGTLPMPRFLRDIAGVRLIVDRYDPQVWHAVIGKQRYHLRERGGTVLLYVEDGRLLGHFTDWDPAVAGARAHAEAAGTLRPAPFQVHLPSPGTDVHPATFDQADNAGTAWADGSPRFNANLSVRQARSILPVRGTP